jgi:Flp pilus assembly protein TadD
VERDHVRAEALYREAVALLDDEKYPDEKHLTEAEKKLREALGFDLYHGPAHNNLGTILLYQGKLYDASEEFEWARRLMPGDPEPRVNLAIAQEHGGKFEDALETAKSALETSPGNLSAIQTIAFIQVRQGLRDSQTEGYLREIAMRSTDPTWVAWARRSAK